MDLAPDDITTVYNAIYNGTSPGTPNQATFNLELFSLAETHEVRDRLIDRLGIQVETLRPRRTKI